MCCPLYRLIYHFVTYFGNSFIFCQSLFESYIPAGTAWLMNLHNLWFSLGLLCICSYLCLVVPQQTLDNSSFRLIQTNITFLVGPLCFQCILKPPNSNCSNAQIQFIHTFCLSVAEHVCCLCHFYLNICCFISLTVANKAHCLPT